MEARTRIELLGRFVVSVDGTAIPEGSWRLRKSRSILKVLALAPGRALHPERLQSLLWPDRDPASAANNLRQAVYHARRALTSAGADGAAVLATHGDLLALSQDVALDLEEFELAAAHAETTHTAADLERAVAAYTGELLPEDVYEDWAADRRRSLAERHVRLLLALAAERDPAAAVDLLHRTLAADPLNEEAHRALMRAYAATGRRTQALAQYELLRQSLFDELAADPEPLTRELYRELLAEGAPTPDPAGAAAGEPAAGRRAANNLPWQPTSFVGRARELDQLDRLLGTRRLITLTGPGGCGKTRLALELARRRVDDHRDGAWVIELAGIADASLVGQAAAHALGLDLDPQQDPAPALAQQLADRELLLVLDNCEHLLGACAHLVETVLQSCPAVAIVATSREPLHLAGEVDWRVPSLSLSQLGDTGDPDALVSADAVHLFCDRATAANPRFALTSDNARAVVDLCFRLDGLPLAIELAAARVSTLSPAQIAERLNDGLAVLKATRAGALTRQQTLEGTLDWSHQLLVDPERMLFRRLSVFAGGFELEAAEAVGPGGALEADAILDVLSGLVDKSLVNVEDAGASYRYRLLEPVRQYAAARLREAGEMAVFAERHARWFAACTDLPGGRVADADPAMVARLQADEDNLRTALAWMLEHDPERSLEMAAGMSGLWLLRGYLREGCTWLDRALAAGPEPTLARCDALHARQALDRRRPETYDFSDQLCEQRVAIHNLRGDVRGECLALLDLADGYLLRGRFAAAADLPERAAELADTLGEPGLRGAARERAGIEAAWRNDYQAAEAAFAEAMELYGSAPADAAPASAVVSLSCYLADHAGPASYPVLRFEETSLHFRRVTPQLARASLLSHSAYMDRARGRFDEARAALDEALAIARTAEAEFEVARFMAQRGSLEATAGDLDGARSWLSASLAERRRLLEHRGILLTMINLAVVGYAAGDGRAADALLAQATRMADEAVDGPGMGGLALARAEIARRAGEFTAARASLGEAVEVYGRMGLLHQESWLRVQYAFLSLELGDLAAAAEKLARARSGFTECRVELGLAYCGALEARLAAANGEAEVLTPR